MQLFVRICQNVKIPSVSNESKMLQTRRVTSGHPQHKNNLTCTYSAPPAHSARSAHFTRRIRKKFVRGIIMKMVIFTRGVGTSTAADATTVRSPATPDIHQHNDKLLYVCAIYSTFSLRSFKHYERERERERICFQPHVGPVQVFSLYYLRNGTTTKGRKRN